MHIEPTLDKSILIVPLQIVVHSLTFGKVCGLG